MSLQSYANELIFPKASTLKIPKIQFPCLIEEKLDGMRLCLMKGFACGRNTNSLGYRDNLWDKLGKNVQSLAREVSVDGELIWPGHPATDVSTALAEGLDVLEFIGFYLPDERRYPMEHLQEVQRLGIPIPRLLYRGYRIPCLEKLESSAKECGAEGWVCKERLQMPRWWKYKLEETYDVIVTGFNISTAGKHKGKLKSIRGSAYVKGKLIEVANISGMNEAIRYAFDTKRDIGRVLEVKAQEIASKGRLRHPRFIRWRDDKPAKECIIET